MVWNCESIVLVGFLGFIGALFLILCLAIFISLLIGFTQDAKEAGRIMHRRGRRP
jgi:hypothetical protein